MFEKKIKSLHSRRLTDSIIYMHENQQTVSENIKQHKIIYLAYGLLLLFIPLVLFVSKERINNPPEILLAPTPLPNHKSNRVEGQITLKFKQGITEEQINQALIQHNALIVSRNPQINWIAIQVPEDQTDTMLEKLTNNNLVEKAEPNYIYHSASVPNDPMYGKQYHLKNTGQTINNVKGTAGADINIEQAWDITQGNGIKVALVDSGINLNHEDLQDKVIAQKSFIQGDTSVEDGAGHGTNDAGILAATANNSLGVTGVCPGCKLIIARATDDDANGTTASIANSITWAADQGAQIINMSLGGDEPGKQIEDAVTYALQKGAILVAAAGNCGDEDYADSYCDSQNPKFYPAAYDGVISVTATDNTDKRYIKASYGTWVKIAAPGFAIFATIPNHEHTQTDNRNYDFYSGTSQAAPQVSGVLALLLATGLSRDAAIERMYTTAEKIQGTGTSWQYGRLDAGKALAQAAPTTTLVPTQVIQQPTQAPSPNPTAISLPSEQPVPTVAQPTQPQEINPTCAFATLGGQPCITPSVAAPPAISDVPPAAQDPLPNPAQTGVNNTDGLLGFLLLLIQLLLSLF